MSTNSLTFASVTGITSDAQRDAIAADDRRYAEALKEARRAYLDGFDMAGDYAGETARRIAHVAVDHGNYAPIIDQLERAYA